METFLFLFEMLGTIAFAASGAVLGVRKGLDVFGVCFLGLTTACGGGPPSPWGKVFVQPFHQRRLSHAYS